MKQHLLEAILHDIRSATVAIYGDFCLDAYWILDKDGGEISVETGLKTEAVRKQYYTLGGASNVVANLAALQPAHIKLAGVIGNDIFGREMLQQFARLGVDSDGLLFQQSDYDTVVFAKRYIENEEQPRIDFGFRNQRSAETDDAIIHNLRQNLLHSDALIFNQQVPESISKSFIEKANQLFKEFNDKIIILDSRHFGRFFKFMYRKTNDIEAEEMLDIAKPSAELTTKQLKSIGQTLYAQFQKPVFITLGSSGILSMDSNGIRHTPGLLLKNELDTVGAGDTVMSALSLALGAGYDAHVSAEFANLAAGVTVQKLFQTGTASAEEMLELNKVAEFGPIIHFNEDN